MSTISPRVREIAENLNMNLPRRAGGDRLITPRFAAIVGVEAEPHQDVVQRLRLTADEVAPTVAEVRSFYAARGRRRITWEVSDHATPEDLGDRLLGLGMVPDEPYPLAVGMVLARPIEVPAGDVAVREVTTLDDFRAFSAILAAGFGAAASDEDPEAVARRFDRERADPQSASYLAFVGGAPVAAATALYLDEAVVMGGAVTLPEARGKGAYRALIAARLEEGKRRGAPALVTQAGAMSRPILRRLGFEEVASIRIYLDAFG